MHDGGTGVKGRVLSLFANTCIQLLEKELTSTVKFCH